jgi:hypothetical protein
MIPLKFCRINTSLNYDFILDQIVYANVPGFPEAKDIVVNVALSPSCLIPNMPPLRAS